MKVKMPMGFSVLFISVFYLIGLGLLGAGLWSAWRSTRAASWPTARATITSLDMETNFDSESSTYEVKVAYRYTVDGVSYDGSRLAFGYSGSSDRGVHEEVFQRLQGAQEVLARYDPARPSVSCLSIGIHRSIQMLLAFAATWLMFVIGFTLLIWLSSRRDGVLLDSLMVR